MPTKIEWSEDTLNFVTGCSHAGSMGCDFCYSLSLSKRLQAMGLEKYKHGFDKVVCHDDPKLFSQPSRWKKPRQIFVNSMSDTFHPDVPFEYIDKMYKAMFEAPQHLYQILTKRAGRMLEYLQGAPFDVPSNIWHGVTAENQEAADERLPLLLECPCGSSRFVSCEPLIGPVNLGFGGVMLGCWQWVDLDGLPWILVGGESGPKARKMDLDWAHNIVKQCKDAGVNCFVKQLGTVWARENGECGKGNNMDTWPKWARVRDVPWGIR